MDKLVSLGPWMGINNVHQPSDRAFQLPGELEKRLPALVTATDVDITDDGWPVSRLATLADTALSTPIGGWTVGGRMFYQTADRLYERTTTDTLLVSGLVGRASICEHWGLVFVTDGAKHWEIDGTAVRVWGLPVPTIALSAATGHLVAGQYLVQCSFVDARGNEGGTSDTALATLITATGISIAVSGQTPDVVAVNVYVSRRDQKQTSYLATVALANFPYVVTDADVTIADPPKTLQMTGPIFGASGLFSFRGFLLAWRDGVVFRSEAAEPHLFHGENFMQFGSEVRACEGVAGGMWIGTASGLWWVQGEDPAGWIPVRKTFSPVLRGSTRIQGNKLKRTQADNLVALFVTESGFVAGMPDGTAVHLTDGVYKFDSHTRASFAYVERDDLRQVLIALVED